MARRKVYSHDDILLTPGLHPVGTRMVLSASSTYANPYEAVVAEWSPSGKLVKLFYGGAYRWVTCWDYNPVVLEVLPPLKGEES